MKQLEDSILNFIQTINKYPQEEFPDFKNGGVRYRLESVNLQVDEKIYLSPELQFFYEHCEIICDSREDGFKFESTSIYLGSPSIDLWSPEGLVSAQDGYRWIGTDDKEDPSWSPFWLVIGGMDGDPIVVVTDKEGSPVMASYETGDLMPIANSLAEFLDYFVILFELIHGKYNGEIRDDETCEVFEGFLEDLQQALSKVNTDAELVANFIEYFYG